MMQLHLFQPGDVAHVPGLAVNRSALPAEITRHLGEIYPKGRTIKVEAHPDNRVRLSHLSGTDGGTWGDYYVIPLADLPGSDRMLQIPRPEFLGPMWARTVWVEIPPGFAVIERLHFCGHDCGVVIHARGDGVQGLLPPPVELTKVETLVLQAINVLRRTRAEEFLRTRYRMSGADLEVVYLALQRKGLITKGVCLTTAAKNLPCVQAGCVAEPPEKATTIPGRTGR